MAKKKPRIVQSPFSPPKNNLPKPKAPAHNAAIPGFPTQRGSQTPWKIPETARPNLPVGAAPLAGGVAAANAQTTQPPDDEQYLGEFGSAGRRYSHGTSGLAGQENEEAYDTGFSLQREGNVTMPDGTIVPGAVSGFSLDVSNPFSKASLLQRNFIQQQGRTNASFAARGHLYGGGRQSAQGSLAFGRDQQDNAMRSAFQKFISQARARRTGLSDTYDTDILAAKGGRRDRAADAQI